MDHHNFKGKNIPHINLNPEMTIEDLVDVYSKSGFNGRQLGNAAKYRLWWEKPGYSKC